MGKRDKKKEGDMTLEAASEDLVIEMQLNTSMATITYDHTLSRQAHSIIFH